MHNVWLKSLSHSCAPASTPDQLCLCSVSIFAFSFQQLHIHVYVGALGRAAASSPQTTNSIICPRVISTTVLCRHLRSAALQKQPNSLLNMTRRHTQCALISDRIMTERKCRPESFWCRTCTCWGLKKHLSFWTTKWFGNMKRADVCIFSDKIHFVILVK